MVRMSDARMSGTAYGTIVLHIAPEAAVGGPLGLVRSGDRIRLSVKERRLDLLVDEKVLEVRRRTSAQAGAPALRGYDKLFRESALASADGCDFDFLRREFRLLLEAGLSRGRLPGRCSYWHARDWRRWDEGTMSVARAIALFTAAGWFAALSSGPAASQSVPIQEPQLRIDAGMHTGQVRRIGVDAACTLLATASDDKTVRLWRLPQGKLINTLRPPIGAGHVGKVFGGIAMAPNGSWVAAGGWFSGNNAEHVYIFDASTGQVVTRFGPFNDVINHLAVSPDGRFLAVAMKDGKGVAIWEKTGASAAEWKRIAEDNDYNAKDVYGAIFDRANSLYTVSYDGKLRRYTAGYTAKPISVVTAGRSSLIPYPWTLRPGTSPSALATHGRRGLRRRYPCIPFCR